MALAPMRARAAWPWWRHLESSTARARARKPWTWTASTMLAAFSPIIGREVLAAARRPMDAFGGLAFFVIVGSLFPLAVGPDAALLAAIGPGVVWVAALLAVLISLHRVFAPDFEDGTLEQMLLSPYPLTA